MNKIFALTLALALAACQSNSKTNTFGEKFANKGSVDFKSAMASYASGKDSTYIITGTIENICQGEGCWLSFKNDSTEFVVNTHEKFNMPKDSKGKKATAKGRFTKSEDGELEFSPTGVTIE
jgi:hypothetical protein